MNTHFFWEDLYEYTHTYVEWYINVRKLLKKNDILSIWFIC